jgi:hypothetical protein
MSMKSPRPPICGCCGLPGETWQRDALFFCAACITLPARRLAAIELLGFLREDFRGPEWLSFNWIQTIDWPGAL